VWAEGGMFEHLLLRGIQLVPHHVRHTLVLQDDVTSGLAWTLVFYLSSQFLKHLRAKLESNSLHLVCCYKI
jgi:hypothetical protein